MQALTMLAELALRSLLLGCFGVLTDWIVRRRGAEIRHAIWRIVLIAMLALPLLSAFLPSLVVLPDPRVIAIATNLMPISQVTTSTSSPSLPNGPSVISTTASEHQVVRSWPQWPALLLAVYGAVVILLLLRTAAAVRRAKKTASDGARITSRLVDHLQYPRPELRQSAKVNVPFTIGWRDAVIVLPHDWRKWDEFKLRSVLTHEVAHVRRRDCATALAAQINRAVFFYNPLAWWLERRLAALSEEACDATAIRSTGDGPRYAAVVLEFAKAASRRPATVAISMARTSGVGRRINRILEGRVVVGNAITGFAAASMMAIALPAVSAVAALQFSPQVQVQTPAPAQTSSSSQPAVSRSEAFRALLADGWKVNEEEATKLESQLAIDPHNLSIRARLISYYTQYLIAEPRTAHLLWLIEHHPAAEMFRIGWTLTGMEPNYTGLNTPLNAERARALWLQQAERFPTDTRVLANAALALISSSPQTALDLVKRARAVEPADPQWVNWLGSIYARAVRSTLAGGPNRIGSLSAQSQDPDAWLGFSLPLAESQALKTELETSSDAALVAATGEALVFETARLSSRTKTEELAASEAFGQWLLSRARELAK